MRSAISGDEARLQRTASRFRHPYRVLASEAQWAQGSTKAPPLATAPSPLARARKCRILGSGEIVFQSFEFLRKNAIHAFPAAPRPDWKVRKNRQAGKPVPLLFDAKSQILNFGIQIYPCLLWQYFGVLPPRPWTPLVR
jgi:hypothetical protein